MKTNIQLALLAYIRYLQHRHTRKNNELHCGSNAKTFGQQPQHARLIYRYQGIHGLIWQSEYWMKLSAAQHAVRRPL
ncbi:MAG: hypothetical protein JW915_03230, partial [Chitinispirillaceae bacterium]|nr:hypothetical protein [Chitinispirillaceae bacterium]